MKFTETKTNLKEIGLDAKALAVSSVSLVVDTVKVPVSVCKDIRNRYLERKALKESLNNDEDETIIVEKEPKVKKSTKKPAVVASEA